MGKFDCMGVVAGTESLSLDHRVAPSAVHLEFGQHGDTAAGKCSSR